MQTTVKKPVQCRGINIKGTGEAKITLEPAPADTGILFIREDLPGTPVVRCCSEDALVDSRWTSLEQNGVRVEHTEHLLAAVRGMGIDNLVVRMNCSSLPVVDGYSCRAFVQAVLRVGLQQQQVPKRYIEVKEPCLLKDEFYYRRKRFNKYIAALPARNLELTYILDYPDQSLPSQGASYIINREIFINQLADARSYITGEEYQLVAELIGKGMESVLVFSKGKAPRLRYANEPARHKLVDLLGDLGTAGCNIKGKFIAFRSGHKLNIEMIKKITK
ncbi:UDP-3-O-acyl N-acetylglucosamine deacetylase [Desulfohalotomaculum tongense]|uniref:UDP-3-O-acyl-N-acetylglucosamine deacetylase n=1 Tax=Desulforadius tongensis TaxID=1216062 RepID=UPI00195C9C53|nr:UDP-3-O-acyl-N-acetylglucosamine deacetylase [Desulforadius tongensis]MBM7855534.1 UDP-3-O-acyl N-acetylglucosamine deacetylase [Desulforadius tongensis]